MGGDLQGKTPATAMWVRNANPEDLFKGLGGGKDGPLGGVAEKFDGGVDKMLDGLKTGWDDFMTSLSAMFASQSATSAAGGGGGVGGLGGFLGSLFGGGGTAATGATASAGAGAVDAASWASIFAAEGGLLTGPSHANGGIPLEAEGGEYIVNAKSTKKYLPMLMAMNDDTNLTLTNLNGMKTPNIPHYANGGPVGTAASIPPPASAPNNRIVNVVDPSMAKDYLTSSEGENVILNVIRRNNKQVSQLLT